jgi:hypothetical protein
MESTKQNKLATSHDGKFSYWLRSDRYVYQRNEITGEWIGWFCSEPAWERTFCNSTWMTLAA